MSKLEWEPESKEAQDIKNKINNEGWESDKKGTGVAVLIGKEEEMPNLENKLENEGKTKDLSTYIKMHKETLFSKEDPEMNDIQDAMKELPEKLRQPGFIFSLYYNYPGPLSVTNYMLKYLSKDQTVSECAIDLDKIAEFKDCDKKDLLKKMIKKLENLGFKGLCFNGSKLSNFIGENFDLTELEKEKYSYIDTTLYTAEKEKRRRLEEESSDKKTKEFDF